MHNAETKIYCLGRSKKYLKYVLSIFFSSEEFSRVRRDAKQMSAAIAISRKPVSVISGRGGTGKTEVVTTTLNAIDKFLTEKVNAGAAFKT